MTTHLGMWSGPLEEFDSDIVKVPSNAWNKRRPPLSFNPEKVGIFTQCPSILDAYSTLQINVRYSQLPS